MSDVGTRQDEIAKRYGGVLFDLAQESKSKKAILKEVTLLHKSLKAWAHEWSWVMRPNVSVQTQLQIMEKIASSLKLGTLMKRFLVVLCQNRRLQNLQSVLNDFIMRSQLSEGMREGVIETASELSKNEIEALEKSLKIQLGKDITLHQVIKETLLAGVILKIGSIMIDASLGTQLHKIRFGMKG